MVSGAVVWHGIQLWRRLRRALPGRFRVTVRYYLAQGLLPAVGQTGPGSKYTDGHLARLRVIRRLQAEHLPLAEIRRRLETLDAGDVEPSNA